MSAKSFNFFNCLIIFVLLLHSLPSVFGQVAIRTAFQVATGAAAGTCDNEAIDQLWAESWTLVQNAIHAVQDVQAKDSTLQELFATFFGAKNLLNNNVVTTVLGNLQAVAAFMNGGNLWNAQNPSGGRPLLFCDDKWLVKKDWDDQLQDENGALVFDSEVPPSKISIYDFGVGGSNIWLHYYDAGQVPWRFDILQDYIFDGSYSKTGGSYCASAAGNLAGTQDTTVRSTMTLCPVSFKIGRTATTLTLGSVNPNVRDFIQLASPVSLTLFHELFHLVLTCAQTPDEGKQGGAQVVIDIASSTSQQRAIQNPESYAYFALAAYYWYDRSVWYRAGNVK